MYRIGKMPYSIDIGFTGETGFRKIEIDMTEWMADTPDGVPSIVAIRPMETEDDAYIAATTFEDNILTWVITAGDLGSAEGDGIMQVWLEEEENDSIVKRGKSVKVITKVQHAVNSASEDPPAAQAAVLEQMTALKTATVNAAADAEEAVEHYPYVDETTGNWFVWDADGEEFVDTEVHAQGPQGETGQTGPSGSDGSDGADGVTFTPSVSAEGVISWTNDGGKENPTSRNITGPAGQDGEDGADGADGYTPVKGTDYWTAEDKAEIVADAAADVVDEIIDDNAGDGDTDKVWSADKMADEMSSVNSALSAKYTKPETGIPASDLASGVIPTVHNVPSGGTAGQVLAKASGTNYDLTWTTVQGGGSDSAEIVDIASLVGQSTIESKIITGNSTYQTIITMDLYANTQYYINVKLKTAITKSVYVKMVQSDGTTIGYSDSISAGNTYMYKSVTPSVNCPKAMLQVSSSGDFEIEYANLFSNAGLMKQIGRAFVGDDITMLSVTSSNKKTISGAGTVSTETDSSMYVSDEIEIQQGYWYMVTGSAGYSSSYYAIYDADHNTMMAERSPSGSGTTCVNRMVYMPKNSKYIRVAYVTSLSGGHVALCNSFKTKRYNAPDWWYKFLEISYSNIGLSHINTLETYISAGHFGFPVCKGDVRPTSDSKLIMCHDGGFTFDGNGRITTYDSSNKTLIHNMTHAQAMEKEYAGQEGASDNNHYQKVADIDGYLQVCKQYGMIAFVTIREDYISTVCTELIAALKRNNMLNRAIINSYTPQALSYIRMLCDDLPISYVQSDNYNLGAARVNAMVGYGKAAITLVSTPSNMRTYLTGIATHIATANTKGVGIMYAQPTTLEDVQWLRENGIMGSQIGRPCLPYRFDQIRFKISISSGTASLAEWFDMTTMEATVSQSSNTISVSGFKIAGSERGFPDLVQDVWMNKFPYRITATSENGNSVTAVWSNNALNITVGNIATNDTIDVMIEV